MPYLKCEICSIYNLERPYKWELESFIMGGGTDGDYPKICPHVVEDEENKN